MTTRPTDDATALYGRASLILGALALIAAMFIGYAGVAFPLLFGSLAVTFGTIGLTKRVHRVQCAIGLTIGGLAVLYPIFLLMTFSG
ncbi:hypothetical protein QWM81_20605 [Streptomyces ficellus]|uniref:DUF4190 domain-containing protein n=1 Tax=Streptomyces ficellus TaxID=1977088 RepID=A0ABT7ZAD7_9ACTN|nr:hypothetical protein [Streptomyces ficellus]MDN3296416.1 hypothetical protein [Streptomyces ficellus]